MKGSNGHRERGIFSKHCAIDRFLGRRYSRRWGKRSFEIPIRLAGMPDAGLNSSASTETQPTDAVPVPTFVDGVAEMRVLDAIRAAAADGGAAVSL